jgi:hypothetical protein
MFPAGLEPEIPASDRPYTARLRSLDLPAPSESLYRLSHLGPRSKSSSSSSSFTGVTTHCGF